MGCALLGLGLIPLSCVLDACSKKPPLSLVLTLCLHLIWEYWIICIYVVGCLNVELLVEFALEKLQLRTSFVRNMRLCANRRCRLKEILLLSHVLTFMCSTQLRWERNIGQNNESLYDFAIEFHSSSSSLEKLAILWLAHFLISKGKSWFHKFVQKMPLATLVPWPIWH